MQYGDIPHHAAKRRSDSQRLYHHRDMAMPEFLDLAYCCFDILLAASSFYRNMNSRMGYIGQRQKVDCIRALHNVGDA